MKKFIAMLVAMLLCVTAVFGLAACGDEGGDDDTTPPVVVTAEDAIKEIETLYGRDAKETSETYDLMGIVTVNGKKFNVDWTVTEATNQITIAKTEVFVKDAEGNDTTTVDYRHYTVTVPHLANDVTVPYTITATITEGEATKTATFERTAVHGHVYADATCTLPATCDCGLTTGDALGCIDENNDFKCDRCGEKAGEGEGTTEAPYVIGAADDYICLFPGGYSTLWYTFTATENCYITITPDYATAHIQIGADIDDAYNCQNYGSGEPVKYLATKGQTVVIGIAEWYGEEVDIPFTVAAEKVTFKDVKFLAGNWSGTEVAMWGSANYVFEIKEDGTGTGYYDMGWGQTTFDITAILYVNDDIVVMKYSEVSLCLP